MTGDLQLSAKFANYLAKLGMLEPLVNGLKLFREYQNYPFVLAQKRIIKQSVFKALCEYYVGGAKKPKVDTLLDKVEQIAEKIYGEDRSASGEITKDLQKTQKELKEKLKTTSLESIPEQIPIMEGDELPPGFVEN